jgi:hypothetical protein
MTDQLTIPASRARLWLVPFKPEPPPPEAVHWRDAYRHMEPRARAIPLNELLAVNIDIPTAVIVALGTARSVQELRQEVRKQLPTFDLSVFDRLKTVAQAAGHAHVLWLVSDVRCDNVPALSIKCQALRQRLHDHAIALAAQGVLSRNHNHLMISSEGLPLAKDFGKLTRYLRVAWDEAGFDGPRERRDLQRAEELADELFSEAAKRETAQSTAEYESTEQRQRFFTLLVQEYEQIRRAVTFVRWNEGDGHRVAPTLFRESRPRRRRKKDRCD